MRFETAVPIGQGATGQVFRARDVETGEDVALKVLHSSDPTLVARLEREARLQARIEHPNVARILDVGHLDDGRPFVAMQLVEGTTLEEAAPELGLAGKVRVVRDVARAVDAAHGQGLVHRDLKPSNIMVTRDAAGAPMPVVVDFGIARELEVSGPTLTGQVIGTPGYLAPEQARGETRGLDGRADVFTLGVILYELLAGSLPFEGEGAVELLVAVVERPPKPLRRVAPQVPADLQRIVDTCLRKAPEERYETAGALAEDLDRFLRGEPILTTLPPLPRRLANEVARSARRSPRISAAFVVAAVAALGAGGWGLFARWESSRRAELVQRATAETERLGSRLREARLLPLHDLGPLLEEARSEREELAAGLARLDRRTRPLALLALARLDLELGEPDSARRRLEEAWGLGLRTAEVAALLGESFVELYVAARNDAQRETDPERRAERLTRARTELRDPARRFLSLARSRSDAEESRLHLARIAYVEEREAEALALLEEEIERRGGSWEALGLAGQIHRQRGDAARWAGEFEEAARHLGEALEAQRRATTIARSAPRAHLRVCDTLNVQLELDRDRGRPIGETAAAALEACERALRADPGLAEAALRTARVRWRQAMAAQERGEDPTVLLREVIAAGAQAFAADPRQERAFNLEGLGWIYLGRWQDQRGEDPRASFRRAIAALEAGLEHHPGYRTALNNLGLAWAQLADDLGPDPEGRAQAFTEAIAAYEASLASDPDYVYAWNNLAVARYQLGALRLASGESPLELYRGAVEAASQALARNARYANALNTRANAHRLLAGLALFSCSDAETPLEAALRDSAAARAERGVFNYWWVFSHLQRLKATIELDRGGDPAPAIAEARGALARALELNPAMGDVGSLEAQLDLLEMESRVRRAVAGPADVARLCARIATYSEIDLEASARAGLDVECRLLQATAAARRGAPMTEPLEASRSLLAAWPPSASPEERDALEARAQILAAAAETGDAADELRACAASTARRLLDHHAYRRRALLVLLDGERLAVKARDATEAEPGLDDARELHDELSAMCPDHPMTRAHASWILAAAGRPDLALAELDAVLDAKLAPLAPWIEPLASRLRSAAPPRAGGE